MLKTFRIICLVALSTFLIGCLPMGGKETIDNEITELEGTSWKLIGPKDLKGTIQFNSDLTQVSGNNGCNDYSADLVKKNYEFSIDRFVSTKKYCKDWAEEEQEFMYLLSQTRVYSLTKNRLQFRDETGTLMTFEKIEE